MSSFTHALLNSSFRKDRSLFYISAAVFLAHCLLIAWSALIHPPAKLPPLSTPRMVVQTVTLSPASSHMPTKSLQKDSMNAVSETPEEIVEEIVEEMTTKETNAFEELEEKIPAVKSPFKSRPKPVYPPSPDAKQPKASSQATKAVPANQSTPKKKEEKQPLPAKPVEKKAPPPLKPAKPKTLTPKASQVPVKKPALESKSTEAKPSAAERQAIEQKKKIEAEQKANQARQQQLLASAQERIAKIAQSRDKGSPAKRTETALTVVPIAITGLEIEALSGSAAPLQSERELSYNDELAGRLKLQLRLPEYGDVKIKLTLERAGSVAKVEIISAESSLNRKYIEKTLPTLTFPPFGANFNGASQYTFAITLSNE